MKNCLRSNLLTIMVFSSLLCPLSASSVKATNLPAKSKAVVGLQTGIKIGEHVVNKQKPHPGMMYPLKKELKGTVPLVSNESPQNESKDSKEKSEKTKEKGGS